ncbi:MAG: hypothetical protein VXZ40_04695 [Nanoarchaeota archaeon]|nr:hypothetical protein [Nanoarchaeota archaeon]
MADFKSFSDKGVQFTFNEEKAIEVCTHFFHQFLDKGSFFARHQPPQFKFFPKVLGNSPYNIANYFLNLVILDVGDVSDQLYKRVSTFANAFFQEQGTHFFTPENILSFDNPEALRKYMNEYWRVGIGFKRKFTFMMENAQKILDSKINLTTLDEQSNFDILKNREVLRGFSGININSSLYQRYMIDFNLWRFDNSEELVVKVDTHKVRFPFQFGFYNCDLTNSNNGNLVSWHRGKFEELFEEMYRDIAVQIGNNEGYTPLEVLKGLDEIIWRLRASYCSQNSMKQCINHCEFSENCNGNPYLTTQISTKIKTTTMGNQYQISLLEDNLSQDELTKYNPKGLIDRISGNQIFPKPGNIYPFVDVRRENIPIKQADDLLDSQIPLF